MQIATVAPADIQGRVIDFSLAADRRTLRPKGLMDESGGSPQRLEAKESTRPIASAPFEFLLVDGGVASTPDYLRRLLERDLL